MPSPVAVDPQGPDDPQSRATGYRIALEQLLQQARSLEEQIARLADDLDTAEEQQQKASERSQRCAEALQSLAAKRDVAERRAAEIQQNVTLAEQRVSMARLEFERANAALADSDRERRELEQAEELARAELDEARRIVAERRGSSAQLESALAELQQRIGAPRTAPAAPTAANPAPEPAAADVEAADMGEKHVKRGRFPVRTMMIVALVLAAVALGILVTTRLLQAAMTTTSVCYTTMSGRLAQDLARDYATAKDVPLTQFSIHQPDDQACEVRLWAAKNGPRNLVIGHDAIVLAVNPLNGVARLSNDQLRGIFTGRITNWAQLGSRRATIEAFLPEDNSDEGRLLVASVFAGARIDQRVHRMPSADIVKAITGSRGRDGIGLVPFSSSVPAKVVALGSSTPSTLSIGNGKYPLSVDMLIDSDWRNPRPFVRDMIAFAHSPNGQAIVMHAGLVNDAGH